MICSFKIFIICQKYSIFLENFIPISISYYYNYFQTGQVENLIKNSLNEHSRTQTGQVENLIKNSLNEHSRTQTGQVENLIKNSLNEHSRTQVSRYFSCSISGISLFSLNFDFILN
ncbi:hypothetical protein OESDEN_05545 [Oesophagostomum dentatum]|uniref:Uncharacterized protein n=1 Tax=Oesophagostomum dentatum TaxID=61180 RepID=A0A0B1TAD6_OESDE|nr:hypothetical protein OESDEN_05545 [Oesophagostomum dentatum]